MEHLFVRGNTDTAHPQAVVPIYFIHTIQQPFCNRPGCWCQTNKARVTPLLDALKNDELMLREAANLTQRREGTL